MHGRGRRRCAIWPIALPVRFAALRTFLLPWLGAELASRLLHVNFMANVLNDRALAGLYRRRESTMRKNPGLAMLIGALLLPLAGCNDPQDTKTTEQSYGASPTLPAPQNSLIPTINVATATSWPSGGKPTAANGMAVSAFATR